MADNVLFLGGIFNITVFYLPLYVWAWIALIIFAIVAYVIWRFAIWSQYKPLHGLYWAYKDGSHAAFIFDANLIGEMISERDAKCIFNYGGYEYDLTDMAGKAGRMVSWFRKKLFYYPTVYLDIPPTMALVYKFGGVNKDVEIARHLQNNEWERAPSVVCGGVPVDIIVDTDNWTIRTSPQHRAIERSADMWNDLNTDDPIHSYSKWQKYVLSGEIGCPDEVEMQTTVPWIRIDSAFPLQLEENEWAGKRRQMAEQEYNQDEISKNKLAMYVFAGGVGLAVLVVAVRLITHFIK